MLNVDKYREAIMSKGADAARLDCRIAALRGVGMGACANNLCKMCMRESFRWLFSEHEPPLLENGDGLKPGDWIMVRDFEGEEWVKRQFAYYFDGFFYCAPNGYMLTSRKIDCWEQARLPEDGE